MRIMLDTNILVSALLFPSERMNRMMECVASAHSLVLSSFVVDELKAVVAEKFPSKTVAVDRFLAKANYEFVYTPESVPEGLFEIRDEDDYPVLYTAMVEDVDILITGDNDFAEVKVEKPIICTPAGFMERYSNTAIDYVMKTERLILRRWEESDAESLYEYAKDPDVGPIAGWPPHKSIEESLGIIKAVFCSEEAYAVCLKKDNKAIGAIELKLNGHTDMTERDDECELGYWIGKPFWGRGLIPEAAEEIIRHGFEDLGMRAIWCGYYDGNEKSKRVQEKLGFKYQWTTKDLDLPLMNEKRTGHVSLLTYEDWLSK